MVSAVAGEIRPFLAASCYTIIHKTGLHIDESEVLLLPVHSRETRHLISNENRLVSLKTSLERNETPLAR